MSSKPKPKASVGSTIDKLIYLLFKKILDIRSGKGQAIRKNKAIKKSHQTKQGSKLREAAAIETIKQTDNKVIEKIIEDERKAYRARYSRNATNNTLIDRVYAKLTDEEVPNLTLDTVFNSTVGQAILTDQFRTVLRGQETPMREGQTVEQFQEEMEQTTENVNNQLGVARRERAELKQLEQTPEVEEQIREKDRDISRLEEILNRMEQGMIQREEKATEQRREIKTSIQSLAEQFPALQDNINRLDSVITPDEKGNVRLNKKIGLSDEKISRLISNLPQQYRSTLSGPVRSLFASSSEIDYNTLISGLVGLGSIIATGNPAIGPLVSQGVSMINNFFDFDFNKILGLRTEQKKEKKVITPVNVPAASVSATTASRPPALPTVEEDPRRFFLQPATPTTLRRRRTIANTPSPKLNLRQPERMEVDIQGFIPSPRFVARRRRGNIKAATEQKKSLAKRAIETARRLLPSLPRAEEKGIPIRGTQRIQDLEAQVDETGITRLEAREGALSAATSAALTAASSGSAVAAVLSTIPAGLLGVAARGLTRPQVSNLINYYESQQGRNLDEKTREKVQNTLELIPGAVVGGLVGRAAVSGGISEQPIEVDEAIVAETQAKIDQEGRANKQWAPKQIAANPEILGASTQEMYADDIESSLFDYVTPTSEGANGTIKSNALKRSQFMNDQLRYFNSGVFVPYELFTKFTNQQDLDDLALGEKPIISLPEMKFERLNQQNTWDNVAKHQLVNAENQSVGLFDPYRNFSNVDNFWTNTRDSVLYTINP